MSRSLVALCLLLGLPATAVFAAPERVPVSEDGRTALELTRRDDSGMVMRAAVGELLVERIETAAGSFVRVAIPGFHFSRVPGSPELPQMNRLIAMPHGAVARVEVVRGGTRTIDLADFGPDVRLLPAQPSVSKSADLDTVSFVIDESAYAVAEVSRPTAAFHRLGRLRALDIGRLEISPVRYLPRENKLLVDEDIEVRVVFEGGDPAAGDRLAAATDSPFFDPVYAKVAGAGPLHLLNPDLVREKVSLVVIAPDSMTAALAPLLAWKREKGFNTILGVLGSAEVGGDSYSIREYIAELYRNGTGDQPAPSFVLLVGDVDILPTYTLNGDATDRLYCEMDGDLFPDIYYGRFSVETVAQLEAVVAKTLAYEQLTIPDTSYLGRAVLIAGVDAAYSPVFANGQIRYAAETYFNPAHDIDAGVFLYPESGTAAGEILSLASAGAGFINYTAHGSEIRWSNPRFTVLDVDTLGNSGRFGLVVGNCCLTSKYDYDSPCLGESWLRREDGGAIGYIGGSNSTYWSEDYWWSVGYTSQITDSPIYEGTSQGALDGLFHGGGEGAYVTSDAMIFCGNLAVSEAASEGGTGREEYYWNIYNLLGDPSIVPYLREPIENDVDAPERLSVTATTISIGADPGSYVGLTQNGVLIAGGTAGPTGDIELELDGDLEEGFARLVVTAQNRRPATIDLPVSVPALVSIDPLSIPVGVESVVTVTVRDAASGLPMSGVEIWAEGWWYRSDSAVTDVNGSVDLDLLYSYGPSLTLVGQDAAQPFQAFRDTLAVTALPLTNPNLVAVSNVGVVSAFPLNLEGILGGGASEAGVEIWLFPPEGDPISTSESSINWVADSLGDATCLLVKPGYDVYKRIFPVVKVFGSLGGYVFAASQVVAGVTVSGYADGVLAFETTTNSAGRYDVPGQILAANYSIRVDLFGSVPYHENYFVVQGANNLNIELSPAPKTSLSGRVLDGADARPIAADIELRRRDNNDLYATAETDPVDGDFQIHDLPEGGYDLIVSAPGHMPERLEVDLVAGAAPLLFLLPPVSGHILVLDATSKPAPVSEPVIRRESPKAMMPTAVAADDFTASAMATVLSSLGYTAEVEDAAVTEPSSWTDFDLVVLACGRNEGPLQTLPELRAALSARAAAGDGILVEGGEVGYFWSRPDQVDSLFISDVLHVTQWVQDESGVVVIVDPRHMTASAPHTLPDRIDVDYNQYVDQDLMLPSREVEVVGSWSRNSSGASIITFDPTPESEGGQIVYLTFSFLAADSAVRDDLLQNAVNWLLIPEPGSCSVAGRILLDNGDPGADALVKLNPGGGLTIADADGYYFLDGVMPGTYSLEVTLLNWMDYSRDINLADGEQAVGVDLQLVPDVPRSLYLHPSYPNPFNAGATIAFDLPAEAGTKLAVYDSRGRQVRIIRQEQLPHGYYLERWDGLDDDGRQMPSGIYFARLSVDGSNLVRKMVLVR